MKLYTHSRLDLADKAAVDAMIAATENKANFPIGAEFVIAGGVRIVVLANDGTTVTTGTVTVV